MTTLEASKTIEIIVKKISTHDSKLHLFVDY
jgi:hypothetical protein